MWLGRSDLPLESFKMIFCCCESLAHQWQYILFTVHLWQSEHQAESFQICEPLMLKTFNQISLASDLNHFLSLRGLFKTNNKKIHNLPLFCRCFCFRTLLHQPRCIPHIIFLLYLNGLKFGNRDPCHRVHSTAVLKKSSNRRNYMWQTKPLLCSQLSKANIQTCFT